MQLVEIVEYVLETGVMPMSVEREMNKLLHAKEMNEVEMAMIDQLIDAIARGDVNAIA